MPRFYFHVSTRATTFPDEEGAELADLATAHDFAVQFMYRTMLWDPEEQDWGGWMITVADANSRSWLTLLYPSRRATLYQTFGSAPAFHVPRCSPAPNRGQPPISRV